MNGVYSPPSRCKKLHFAAVGKHPAQHSQRPQLRSLLSRHAMQLPQSASHRRAAGPKQVTLDAR
eukprot:CAMPEP_0117618122 /NCGR_PEP_ID=MMETSP0784-20121206/85938_1 /TAXON_ID=39447 /ORGANISM="" /LENGTH=63 /DNA_ID=CAMNT_0005421971 /DNA_START=396 /DNA_END=583 /DNA_ORIENTATION=-